MVKSGALLMLVSFAALAFWLAPLFMIDSQPVLNILEPILCAPGETLTMEVVVTHDFDGTGYNGDYDCMRRDETTYDVSGKAFLLGAAGFAVPFTLGLLLFLAGINRDVRAARSANAIPGGESLPAWGAATPSQTYSFDVNTHTPASLDLAARLKQLRDAYEAGMITAQEYERTKADLLRDFSNAG